MEVLLGYFSTTTPTKITTNKILDTYVYESSIITVNTPERSPAMSLTLKGGTPILSTGNFTLTTCTVERCWTFTPISNFDRSSQFHSMNRKTQRESLFLLPERKSEINSIQEFMEQALPMTSEKKSHLQGKFIVNRIQLILQRKNRIGPFLGFTITLQSR